jgi:hypothetical protein
MATWTNFCCLFIEHFVVTQLRRNQQKLNQIYIKYLKQLLTRKSSPKAFIFFAKLFL